MFKELVMPTAWICFVVDISGFMDALKQFAFRCLFGKSVRYNDNFRLKPFDCSLCATWWACLGYVILSGECSVLWIFVSGMLSLFSGVISQFLMLLRDLVITIIDKIYNKI